MAQLERPQRQDDAPKAPTIHTMEQLLRADVSKPKLTKSNTSSPTSSGSSPSSPFFPRVKQHDSEEDHGQSQKKSVLAKVKEKAKKLRHSLSKRKDGNSTSPSWGAGQEGDVAEEDAEHHGAPMYESEKAPEGYQENTRQHQRGSPIFPQKHVPGAREPAREKTLTRSLSKKTTETTIPTNTATATTATFSGPMKILTKSVPEKNQTLAYAEGSETPSVRAPKLQALALSKPSEHHNSSTTTAPSKTYKTSLSLGASHTPSSLRSSSGPMASPPPSPPSSAPSGGNNTSPTSQIWDKGVSVKEYLMNKFEPGEDEKALSSVISETMSPRRTPGDVGVIEKVREVVTSLLRTGETTKRADTNTTTTHTSSQIPASTDTTRASSYIPVSSNAQEVAQEENHGRILQAN